jgi:hypothetical protein
MKHPLPRAELLDLHSVLRRAAERAEANKRTEDAAKLAAELANIELELSVTQ